MGPTNDKNSGDVNTPLVKRDSELDHPLSIFGVISFCYKMSVP